MLQGWAGALPPRDIITVDQANEKKSCSEEEEEEESQSTAALNFYHLFSHHKLHTDTVPISGHVHTS